MQESRLRAFGLELRADFPLPVPDEPGPGRPDVELRLASPADIEAAWSGASGPAPRRDTLIDGDQPFSVELGTAGDLRFLFGATAFHLDADGQQLACAPAVPDDPAWMRALLDSVLATVALERGFEALHGGAVAADDGVVALLAASGGGKTSLTLELLARGYSLFSDDVLALSRVERQLLAHPGPPVANVPVAGPGRPPAEVGRVLAEFGDQAWVLVGRRPPRAQRVAALFVLERRMGAAPGVELVSPPTPLPLLPHMLNSGSSPERRARSFNLAADLVLEAPVLRLRGDLATTPAKLADLVERGLALAAERRAGALA